ncbi:U2A'/phosphoprotein 32 family A C-terminal domain-containing protein [Plasmodiophora brassicae]|uniref:Dynein axonemal light chain 1 n=1 Tax=Plasmodiophora brassicae TaxID=37360 RepID=A0A3P3YMT3_PLABS|nr:unnamed protein product [Plasmodiophora brassicae]
MSKIKECLQKWEEKHPGQKASEAKVVKLMCQVPPIQKMDGKLNDLAACEHLSLSTNMIDKIFPLPGLKNLRILSLARNNIKKISGLDELAESLEELWLSYNQIEKLAGLSALKKLRVLYIGNNRIKGADELNKLQELPELQDLLVVGNPFYEGKTIEDRRVEVLSHVPALKKLDGEMVKSEERDRAAGKIEPMP